MTGQSLLNMMEMLDWELQLQTGEVDVTRGLIALNAAQDQFETILSTFPRTRSTTGTLSTTAATETTTFPAGVLRLDRLQFIDPSTNLPSWTLDHWTEAGQVSNNRTWMWSYSPTAASGKPTAYWEDGLSIWWSPVPNATHTIRWTGFKAADDLTAGGTFVYPDAVALPIAATAAKLLKIGLEDDGTVLESLAQEFLVPAARQLDRHNRDGAAPLNYTRSHDA